MTDYTYSPISYGDLYRRPVDPAVTIRATQRENGSVLVGVPVGPTDSAVRVRIGDHADYLVSERRGWTLELGTPVPPPLEPGLYVRRRDADDLATAVPYRVRTRGGHPVTLGFGMTYPDDPADLVRLCTVEPQADAPTSYDVLDGAPEGFYRDVDGDFWRIVGDTLHFRRRSGLGFLVWGRVAERGNAFAPYVPVTAEEARP